MSSRDDASFLHRRTQPPQLVPIPCCLRPPFVSFEPRRLSLPSLIHTISALVRDNVQSAARHFATDRKLIRFSPIGTPSLLPDTGTLSLRIYLTFHGYDRYNHSGAWYVFIVLEYTMNLQIPCHILAPTSPPTSPGGLGSRLS